jgi:RNA polymerase sigma factor (sigma-70 family)
MDPEVTFLMPGRAWNGFMRYLKRVATAGNAAGSTDGWLLERFTRERDEAAFEELVQRHGPMVMGVCRRVLGDPHDAEDAFQAAFLVLIRRARTIHKQQSVGSWLHGVACRTARKARATAARRRHHESAAATPPAPVDPPDASLNEFRLIVDEEVLRLPERYRAPFVLCYLEGVTYQEAARILACPLGTLAARLSRARSRLQKQLTRRGLGLSVAAVGAALAVSAAPAAVPAPLRTALLRAAREVVIGKVLAGGAISPQILALLQDVPVPPGRNTLLILAAAIAVTGLAAVGLGAVLYSSDPGERGAGQAAHRLSAGMGGDEERAGVALRKLFAVPTAHGEQVFSVAVSADGTRAASGHSSQAKVWDVRSGKELATFDVINAGGLAFSPDAKTVATGDLQGNVRVWDAESGQLRLALGAHAKRVSSVACSPDGKLLASGGFDHAVRLWDLATGEEVRCLPDDCEILSVAFSPDGKRLATANGWGKCVRVWDVTRGRLLATFQGHDGPASCVAFAPDGSTVASADGYGIIKIWDPATGQATVTLAGSPLPINGITFAAGGTCLVSAGADGRVRLWDVRAGKPVVTLRDHAGTVWSAATSRDGRTLATAGDDAVRCWAIDGRPSP